MSAPGPSPPHQTMDRIRASDFRPEHLEQVTDGDPLELTEGGRVVGGVVSAEDLERLRELDAEDAELGRRAQESMADYRENGGRPWADVKRDLGL